ncbi:hypothetical protein O0L34_g1564 [Tuta absoluta]|nr:hypothetical protein O0L34_g1564 [Tuta absoluta]
MLRVFILFFCLGAALGKPNYSLDEVEKHFEDFIQKYDRQYADEAEKQMRLEIFKKNLVRINQKNMTPGELAEFDIDHFADLSDEELRSYIGPEIICHLLSNPYFGASEEVHHCQIKTDVDGDVGNIPESLDWRANNIVSSVKSQQCGDCWTYGTAGNVESMYAKKYGKLVDFSEQQLIDCDKNNRGCNGGTFNYSFGGLVTNGGMMTLEDYPYKGKDENCKFDKNKVVAKLKDCIIYDLKNEEQLRAYLATNGPIGIAIDASFLLGYQKGILSNCPLHALNHAMLLVGYGTENGTPYWIVKNSWGKSFGEDGYLRMKRNENLCGIVNPCGGTAVIE